MTVLPPPDSATEPPWAAFPTAPVPTSFDPCWVHTPPLRVNTHAAPAPALSRYPATMAVLPSADSATPWPCWAPRPPLTAPVPTSLFPCWLHTPPPRVNTHAAPSPRPPPALSPGPTTMAVLPSEDTATDRPCWGLLPLAPAPTSLGPCCTKSASEGCAGPSSAADSVSRPSNGRVHRQACENPAA